MSELQAAWFRGFFGLNPIIGADLIPGYAQAWHAGFAHLTRILNASAMYN